MWSPVPVSYTHLIAEVGARGGLDVLDGVAVGAAPLDDAVGEYGEILLEQDDVGALLDVYKRQADMLLGRYPSAYGVRVKLEKPWAPVGLPLRSVSVEIERTRA